MKKSTKGANRGSARKQRKRWKKLIKNIFNCVITFLFLIIIVQMMLKIRSYNQASINFKEATYDYQFGQSVEDFIDDNSHPREVYSHQTAETTDYYVCYKNAGVLYTFVFKNNSLVEVFKGFPNKLLFEIILQDRRSHNRVKMSECGTDNGGR